MPAYAELEISLHRLEGGVYNVEFRLRLPDSEADSQPGGGQAMFDLDELRRAGSNPAAYGQALAGSLFADPAVKAAFAAARAAARGSDAPLRLRLFVGLGRSRAAWPALGDPARPAGWLAAVHRRKPALLALPDQPGLAPGAPAPQGATCAPWRWSPTPPTWHDYVPGPGRRGRRAGPRQRPGCYPVTAIAARQQGNSATLNQIISTLDREASRHPLPGLPRAVQRRANLAVAGR